jgi:hypothetical protein
VKALRAAGIPRWHSRRSATLRSPKTGLSPDLVRPINQRHQRGPGAVQDTSSDDSCPSRGFHVRREEPVSEATLSSKILDLISANRDLQLAIDPIRNHVSQHGLPIKGLDRVGKRSRSLTPSPRSNPCWIRRGALRVIPEPLRFTTFLARFTRNCSDRSG